MCTPYFALAIALVLAAGAHADTRTLSASGLWSAYGGTGDDQRPVCGVATSGADGRRIAIQQSAGETGLLIMLEKPSWSIPAGTPVEVSLQFDNGGASPARGTGSGRHVDVPLAFDQSVPFMRALRVRS